MLVLQRINEPDESNVRFAIEEQGLNFSVSFIIDCIIIQ